MNIPAYLARIQAGTLSFRKIPVKVRTALVGFLKSDGWLTEECARTLGVPVSTVYYHWSKYQKHIAAEARRSAGQFIGRYMAKAEHLYKSAKRDGDLNLCWKIENDLMEKLIKMGWIEAAPDRVDLRVQDDREPHIIEAELADDLSLLERRHGRTLPVARLLPGGNRRNGNGTSGGPGEAGLPQDPPKRGDEE